jgi:hypothetical protein
MASQAGNSLATIVDQHSNPISGVKDAAMFAQEKRDVQPAEIGEDANRDEIAATFRSAMVSHFRSHIPGTDINETTLIASDYLNHFRKLVTLLEAASSQPQGSADDLLSWRPVSYEEHFANSDFRDKALAIAAYRKAPTSGRALFDEAAARFHGEALALVAEIAAELNDPDKNSRELNKACANAARRLRALINEADAIANSQPPSALRRIGALFGVR